MWEHFSFACIGLEWCSIVKESGNIIILSGVQMRVVCHQSPYNKSNNQKVKTPQQRMS